MKLTINRKELVNVLKALKALSAKSVVEQFKDAVVLHAVDGGLSVSAGVNSAFISVTLRASIEEEGKCHISFKLYDLLKAVKDTDVTLSFNKRLSVTTESGLKAAFTESSKVIPVDLLRDKLFQGTEAELILPSESVLNLADISKAFPPTASIRWMDIISEEGTIYGTVQGSEYGELSSLPMEGEGDNSRFTMNPDQIGLLLPFCGERVKLSIITNTSGIYMLTDPDNDSWWAATQRVDKP